MATKKISELSTVPTVDGSETFPILKAGYNYKMTVSQVIGWIGNATASLAGLLSASDKSKLDSMATGATANATNAELRDRATHTGTQAASTITGLAPVAISGSYSDLSGAPVLDTNWSHRPTVAFQSATGTTQVTASAITKSVFHVGSADASNTGIILPAGMTIGAVFTIFNGTGTGLSVYPPSGGQINYAGVNTPYALGAYTPLTIVLIDQANGVYQQI
jgi:hypothetical protein